MYDMKRFARKSGRISLIFDPSEAHFSCKASEMRWFARKRGKLLSPSQDKKELFSCKPPDFSNVARKSSISISPSTNEKQPFSCKPLALGEFARKGKKTKRRSLRQLRKNRLTTISACSIIANAVAPNAFRHALV